MNTLFVNICAQSPSFTRQVLDDAINDLKSPQDKDDATSLTEPNPDCFIQHIPHIDIQSISYTSDGKILNATLWLSEPFYNLPVTLDRPSKDIPQVYKITYSMYIDVNSIYDANIDYMVNYEWRNDWSDWSNKYLNKTWVHQIREESNTGGKDLYSYQNSTNITEDGNKYLNFLFDLKTANYPKNYRIFFASLTDFYNNANDFCKIFDITNYISAPPPEFNISASPNNIELRPGEEKTVHLTIQSITNLDAKVLLGTKSSESIIANLTSKELSILPYNIGTSTLKVKALKDAMVNSYLLPISATISFPEILNLEYHENSLNLNSNATPTITKNFSQSISIIPPLSFEEHLNNIANWLSPINSIWTFITALGAILIPFLIRLYSKKSKETVRNGNNHQYDSSTTSLKGGAPVK